MIRNCYNIYFFILVYKFLFVQKSYKTDWFIKSYINHKVNKYIKIKCKEVCQIIIILYD